MKSKTLPTTKRASKASSTARYFSISEITRDFRLAGAELEVEVLGRDDFGINSAKDIVNKAFKIAHNKFSKTAQ